MSEHEVTGYAGWVAGDVQAVELDAVVHVIIFASPPPEFIAEAVHFLEVFNTESADTTKDGIVW